MKIKKPIPQGEMPDGNRPGERGKYIDIWGAAARMGDDEALPVEFESRQAARSFQGEGRSSGILRGLKLRVRGTTVYITKSGA